MNRVASIHIPKCAGRALIINVANHTKAKLCPYRLMREYETGAHTLGNYDYYGGHTFYEILKDLVPPNTVFTTLLRDPINRIYSHWKYLRKQNANHFYNIPRGISFEQFIRQPEVLPLVSNFQARYLANRPSSQPKQRLLYQHTMELDPLEITEEELYQRARKNLSGFAFVGSQEEFRLAVQQTCLLLGKQPPPKIPVVIADYKAVISDEDKELLKSRNAIDINLYNEFANTHYGVKSD